VSLAEPKERIHFRSKVEAMDKSADGQRDLDAFVMSAKGGCGWSATQPRSGVADRMRPTMPAVTMRS